ncbi:pre-mRNA splicing factor syf-1 [Zychaea mexicana]|uniref:pre-mRNA splicing factor syf-1 n=1 Tax=Zychaea mexicana TaxID=64656 RepID=UPI0022FED5E5|nr:pre-mRNA splicing factor syf-1 [Zychaea mexicana]KAI9495026.1 pre-mRNA splicing factor syf-1 [Zychaea mexicana]
MSDLSLPISQFDIPYEEELLRNPFSLRSWLRYIDHKRTGTVQEQSFIYERAIRELPGSYKLWKKYLDLRRGKVRNLNPVKHQAHYEAINKLYERALALLNKMPRIWLDYCEFLLQQPFVTRTRRTFDRALRALPVTQHSRVWDLYLEFAKDAGGETAIRVLRRYLKFDPSYIENYVDSLNDLERYDEAAVKLASILNNSKFVSARGKSHYQLWQDLCELLVNHCGDITSVKVEPIIRSGIKRFTDQVGMLYCRLAMYWIKMRQLEKARDIFEEGITTVLTVRDFTAIFDAYAEFEEEMITTKIEMAAEREESGEKDPEEDLDLDLRLLRFERLMDRRPFLVNDVLLRQNPNNALEWEKRVMLWGDNKEKVVDTYTRAVQTINPKKVHGKFQQLYIKFARFYEDGGDLDSARAIFDKAVKVNYKNVNDLAEVWCEYAELEVRHDNFDQALDVMARATLTPRIPGVNPKMINFNDDTLPVQARVFKSLTLWGFYVDLEESVGTVESTKAVYDKIMDLRIVNPQIVVNYGTFLEENNYFEDSFRVYERGIEIFGWPIAFELWNIYLQRFMKRYGGTKLERARDLFEQALDKCPPKYAKSIFLMYGQLEEDHGLARHAMRIYDRATKGVADEDRLEMFNYYIAKATASFGIVAAREIYERAIESLPDKDVRPMCLKYAELERKLGEVDRARAIYGYASQFFDPKVQPTYWQTWHDFEVQHGNEDTFKEMLRIKRSVQAQYHSAL